MKKLCLLILLALVATTVAMAQGPTPGVDELGAHNGYGRGCVMCHAPHGGALGNNVTSTTNQTSGVTTAYSDSYNGQYALWGQALTLYYGLATSFSGDGAAKYPVTLPSNPTAGISDANTVILLCLSCHDGNLARVGMMKGTTVETLPIVGGHAPTWFGSTQGNTSSNYANEHPVGGYAVVKCGGGYNWDCTGGDTVTSPSKGGAAVTGTVVPGAAILMNGAASSQFVANYPGSFWNNWSWSAGIPTGTSNTYAGCMTTSVCSASNPLASFSNTSTKNGVSCTVCHNQHSETAYGNSMGNWSTMFFIKGYYNPTTGGNSVAQFCRNCHGGNSNEMVGVTGVGTT